MANAFNWARAQNTAERLITKFGYSDGKIIREINVGTKYDPVKVPQEYDCKLVVLDYEDRKVDGKLILRSDKLIYVSAKDLAIQPSTNDKIFAGKTYNIIDVKPLNPAGIPVFYEVQGRS
jgi:hypothetical protein